MRLRSWGTSGLELIFGIITIYMVFKLRDWMKPSRLRVYTKKRRGSWKRGKVVVTW